jgi:hypothetical protein
MAALTPWEQLVKFIVDGESVKASVANRASTTLANRTQYLYDRLQNLSAGEALFLHYVKIESSAVPGDLVYFDETYNGYKRTLAAVEYSESNGWYMLAPSAFVVGMVYQKTDTERGHLLTAGTLRDFDLSNAIVSGGGSASTPGAYFLSMSSPGKITIMRPAIGIYALYNKGDGGFHFLPTPRDLLEDHIHYKFELYAQPAGEANCIVRGDGQRHQVVNPDPSQPGWLPADYPTFNGAAPDGALFGYNLAKHPELQRVWPPVPSGSVYMEQNGYGLRINDQPRPTVIVNNAGLWWMEDCYGMAPWAPAYPGCESSSSSQAPEPPESSSSGEPFFECHTPLEYLELDGTESRLDEKTLVLWYSKMIYKTDPNVVNELSPCSQDSPILVLDCDGQPAIAGKLCLSLDLSRLAVEEPTAGYDVVKSFSANKLQRGPIVEGLKAGPGAEVVGVGTENQDWELLNGFYRGKLQVQLEDTTGDPKEYQVTLVALNDVLEDYDITNKFFYLHFPSGKSSGVRGRIEIPRLGLSSPLKMRLWMWFVGRSSGSIPALTATYRRYTRPTSVTSLPTSDTDIESGGGLWTPGLTLTGGQYAEAYTDWFTVAQGETVDFTIAWTGSGGPSDGFGIMRFGSRIEVGTP